MKNKFAIFLTAMLVSTSAFAQKDELKTLKKIYDKQAPSEKDVIAYKEAVSKAEGFLATANESDKVYINFFKAEIPVLEMNVIMSKPENQSKPELATKLFSIEKVNELGKAYANVIEFEKKSGKQIYTNDIKETVGKISPTILNSAVSLGTQKKYAEGAQLLHSVYLMDKTNADNLYFAASYAVNAQDYDTALQYYDELKAMKYSGEGTNYIATNVLSGEETSFTSKAERDKMVTFKTHSNPKEEKIPSKRGEIYKNYALILVQKNRVDDAKAAFAEAKAENPTDVSLLVNESDLYLKLKDYETYKKLVADILVKNPNDADLIYNLGVVTLEADQLVEAEAYFKKALVLNPKYTNAYLNLAALKLKPDDKLVAEMNKLGTSDKDNKRYEVLKKEREATFRSALPFLEKGHELAPENEDVATNLLSVYNFLEMTDKYKALKATMNKK